MKNKLIVAVICVMFLNVGFVVLAGTGAADWQEGDGHKMHYPQLPDMKGEDVYASINTTNTPNGYIADDWKCSSTGPISEIHFWGAWHNDTASSIDNFEVKIAKNSLDNFVWNRTFERSEFTVTGPFNCSASWHNPFDPPGVGLEERYYQYNIENISDPYIQTSGEKYWLAIGANVSFSEQNNWGWRTTLTDYVYGDGAHYRQTGGSRWEEMNYHMAFVINGSQQKPCINLTKKVWDGSSWVNYLSGVSPGTDVRYNITINNCGPVDLEDVKVEDTLHSDLEYNATLSYHPPGIRVPPAVYGDNIIWEFDDVLKSGEDWSIEFNATVNGTGLLCNNASVKAESVSGAPVYDGGYSCIKVQEGQPCIDLTKKVWDGSSWVRDVTVTAGTELTYNLTITNCGDVPLHEVNLTEWLPTGLVWSDDVSYHPSSLAPTMSVVGRTIYWNFTGHTLNVGEDWSIEFNATANRIGRFCNNASVKGRSPSGDWVYDSAFCCIETQGGKPCIDLTKKVWNGSAWVDSVTVPVGTELTYNLTITNCGSVPLHEVNLTEWLPTGLVWSDAVSYHPSSLTPTMSVVGRTIYWNFTGYTLNIGEDWSIEFNAIVNDTGYHCNNASVRGDSPYGTRVYDWAHSCIEAEKGQPCIELTKKVWDSEEEEWVDNTNAPVGSEVTFNITIHNCGTCNLTDIYVNDTLVSGLEYVSGSATPIPSIASTHHLNWHFGTLAPGAYIYIEFNATVVETGNNCNFARVSSGSSCPDDESTLHDSASACVNSTCQGCVELTKLVWDPVAEEWDDSVSVFPGSEVKFKITISNCGSCFIDHINVTDKLPSGFMYISGSTEIDHWFYRSSDPTISGSSDILYWELGSSSGRFILPVLYPPDTGATSYPSSVDIIFKAYAEKTEQGNFTNKANVTAHSSCEGETHDSDSASVSVATLQAIEDIYGTDDFDDDGMPNKWEIDYDLDPYDPSDADYDWDGDGYSNAEEYKEGTNPLDRGSRPETGAKLGTLTYILMALIPLAGVIGLISGRSLLRGGKKGETSSSYEEEKTAGEEYPSEENEGSNDL